MINFGGGIPFFLGIFLVLCGVALYALRSYRPQLARDHDIFFAAISSISGFILMFQGWQLNPILQLGQVAIAGSAVFFVVENIRLRGITTEQAKRQAPPVEDDRPVSRDYDYEGEGYQPREPRYRSEVRGSAPVEPGSRRIPGRGSRPARDEWDDRYGERPRRIPARPDWEDDRYDYDYGDRYADRPRERRLPRSPGRSPDPVVMDATWDEAPRSSRRRDDGGDRPGESRRAIPPSRDSRRDYPPTVSVQSSPSYEDEPPVVNVNYANTSTSDASPNVVDGEEDNSGYQDFY